MIWCLEFYAAFKRTETYLIHTKHSRFMLIFCFNYYCGKMSLFKKTKTLQGSLIIRNGFEIGTFSQFNVMHKMTFCYI